MTTKQVLAGVVAVMCSIEALGQAAELTLGNVVHSWKTRLGGVVWLPTRHAAKQHASVIPEYPGELLLFFKSTAAGFGYRFDLDAWEPSTVEYGWFGWDGDDRHEPPNLDQLFQIYSKPNSKLFLHLPMPSRPVFSWQTPGFYAAQCQYLFGAAGADFASLPLKIDYATRPGSFNWADLRARRGRVEPYTAEAVMLGNEPYHIEGWDSLDGSGFGARAEVYRQALRARGVTLPYGVHVSQHSPSDTSRTWFHPMMRSFPEADRPRYLDLYHYYSFDHNDDWLRSFPVARKSDGFINWWIPKSQWQVDYSAYLWMIPDTRLALRQAGYSADSLQLGFSEHGITISSAFKFNDMMGAIHWATWIAELMRLNADWDSMWIYGAEGFSTAQVQYFGKLTLTPAFYVYKLAMGFRGLNYISSTLATPSIQTTEPGGQSVSLPAVIVRAFTDGKKYYLFAINQMTQAFRLNGLEGYAVLGWDQIRGDSYSTGNSLTTNDNPIRIRSLDRNRISPIMLDPISINRIVLGKIPAPVQNVRIQGP